MDGMGAPDVRDAGLGETEKSYLPLLDQIADRTGHVLDRHGPIHAVLIKQVYKVGAEAVQAALHRFTNVLGPAVRADDPVAVETRTELRSDHYLVASAPERPAEQLLVGKGTIVLRRVEESASQFDRAMNRGDRLTFTRRSVRLTHAHATEADR